MEFSSNSVGKSSGMFQKTFFFLPFNSMEDCLEKTSNHSSWYFFLQFLLEILSKVPFNRKNSFYWKIPSGNTLQVSNNNSRSMRFKEVSIKAFRFYYDSQKQIVFQIVTWDFFIFLLGIAMMQNLLENVFRDRKFSSKVMRENSFRENHFRRNVALSPPALQQKAHYQPCQPISSHLLTRPKASN